MAESFTGLVLGMQQMDVNPPAAAAREPLSMVSACSNPGSRRCTCISMKPGATIIPVASNTSAFGGGLEFLHFAGNFHGHQPRGGARKYPMAGAMGTNAYGKEP